MIAISNFKDLTGQKFGRLTVLDRLHNYHEKNACWLCVCECGNLAKVNTPNLRSGRTMSCGCLRKEVNTKHGKYNTRLYDIWASMKKRCYYHKHKNYKFYGGRGVKVYDEWRNNFQTFYDWAMNNGYKSNLTIDRIDVNGNYEPNNCRWVTMKQQSRNTRRNRYFTYNGETHCISEWCEILGLNYNTINGRLRRKLTIEEALELNERGHVV